VADSSLRRVQPFGSVEARNHRACARWKDESPLWGWADLEAQSGRFIPAKGAALRFRRSKYSSGLRPMERESEKKILMGLRPMER